MLKEVGDVRSCAERRCGSVLPSEMGAGRHTFSKRILSSLHKSERLYFGLREDNDFQGHVKDNACKPF